MTPEIDIISYASGAPTAMSGAGNVQSGALEVGAYYTLFVGAAPVRFRFGSVAATATATDAPLGAYQQLSFLVDTSNRHLAVIHYDGSSAHVAALLKSSPGIPT